MNSAIPLCDVQSQFRELKDQIQEAITRVLTSGQVILGPEVAALEAEVARYCGAAFGVGCSSGSDALSLALEALGVGPGDEVILTGHPVKNGAHAMAVQKVVFADGRETPNLGLPPDSSK